MYNLLLCRYCSRVLATVRIAARAVPIQTTTWHRKLAKPGVQVSNRCYENLHKGVTAKCSRQDQKNGWRAGWALGCRAVLVLLEQHYGMKAR